MPDAVAILKRLAAADALEVSEAHEALDHAAPRTRRVEPSVAAAFSLAAEELTAFGPAFELAVVRARSFAGEETAGPWSHIAAIWHSVLLQPHLPWGRHPATRRALASKDASIGHRALAARVSGGVALPVDRALAGVQDSLQGPASRRDVEALVLALEWSVEPDLDLVEQATRRLLTHGERDQLERARDVMLDDAWLAHLAPRVASGLGDSLGYQPRGDALSAQIGARVGDPHFAELVAHIQGRSASSRPSARWIDAARPLVAPIGREVLDLVEAAADDPVEPDDLRGFLWAAGLVNDERSSTVLRRRIERGSTLGEERVFNAAVVGAALRGPAGTAILRDLVDVLPRTIDRNTIARELKRIGDPEAELHALHPIPGNPLRRSEARRAKRLLKEWHAHFGTVSVEFFLDRWGGHPGLATLANCTVWRHEEGSFAIVQGELLDLQGRRAHPTGGVTRLEADAPEQRVWDDWFEETGRR